MNELVNWLETLDSVDVAQPAKVTLMSAKKKVVAEGAMYGHSGVGDLWLYLLTDYQKWPKVIAEKTIFQDQDGDYWYVAAWMPSGNLNKQTNDFHPFGVNVLLAMTSENFAQSLMRDHKVLKMDLQLFELE